MGTTMGTTDALPAEHAIYDLYRFRLEQLRAGHAISMEQYARLQTDGLRVMVLDDALKRLVLTLSARLATGAEWEEEPRHQAADIVTIQWPDGWWQMCKEQYAPAWFKRRWPVRYQRQEIATRTEVVNRTVKMCPHIAGYAHDHSQCVEWLVAKRRDELTTAGYKDQL